MAVEYSLNQNIIFSIIFMEIFSLEFGFIKIWPVCTSAKKICNICVPWNVKIAEVIFFAKHRQDVGINKIRT